MHVQPQPGIEMPGYWQAPLRGISGAKALIRARIILLRSGWRRTKNAIGVSEDQEGWLSHSVRITRMLLLGHRGSRCSAPVPENTFAAFDLALQHGCDGFEFDVRLTRDGVPVICHDANFKRLPISRTPASRLPDLPTLEAVLKRYRTRGFLDIELKVAGIEPRLLQLLARRRPKKGFVISSFLPSVLSKLRRLDTRIPLGLICENTRQLQLWRDLPIDTVIAHQSLVTRSLLKDVHTAGKTLLAWTVNRKANMVRLADMGVDGIISDRTDLLAQTLAPRASHL